MEHVSRAPWTPEEVTSLNEFQQAGLWHPFTCGNESDLLIATPEGWTCAACDYTQDWAHPWMADGSWRAARDEVARVMAIAREQGWRDDSRDGERQSQSRYLRRK